MKKLAFWALVVGLVALFAEGLGWAALRLVTRRGFDRATLQAQLRAAGDRPAVGGLGPQTLLHPYTGYIANEGNPAFPGAQYNRFGGMGVDPLAPRDDDDLVVALAGGSFAALQASKFLDITRAELAAAAGLPAPRVHVLSLANGGFKQPQQLASLTYFLSLGMRPDVVVNLDGFNELVLPLAYHQPAGVVGHFPVGWLELASGAVGTARGEAAGEILLEKSRLRGWRSWLGAGPLPRSNLVLIAWDVLSRRSQKRIRKIEAALAAQKVKAGSLALAGPAGFATTPEAVRAEALDYWVACSRQMRRLAEANGAGYLHALQPNQYLPGSKVLTAAERAEAYRADHPYGVIAAAHYGELRDRGRALAASGFPFVDLTQVYAAEAGRVWFDDCCHQDARGATLLARALGAELKRRGLLSP